MLEILCKAEDIHIPNLAIQVQFSREPLHMETLIRMLTAALFVIVQ